MCCKGKKCFGEQSLMLTRIADTVRLATLGQIISDHTSRTNERHVPVRVVEFMTQDGHWSKLIRAEFIGLDKVVRFSDWPLYLTPDHEFWDGTRAVEHGQKQKDKQLVYALTLDEESIMAGPFFVKVLQPVAT